MLDSLLQEKMIRPLILCILSMVLATDAIYGRRLLQDDDSDEDLYTKYAIGDYDEELAKRKRTEAEEIMQEGAGTAIAIIVMVVVCIGFLAVVGAVIYCICCLPCCVIASRNRREGQVYQRTAGQRAEYPRQAMGGQQQPATAPYQPAGYYPPAQQQMLMQSYPPTQPPPYPGPPVQTPEHYPEPYMGKKDDKN